MKRMALMLMPLFLLAPLGCERRVWWEHQDDPYLRQSAQQSDSALQRQLTSMYVDDRILALRVLADRAARARATGRVERADYLCGVILSRFRTERNRMVKRSIVVFCTPVCGVGCERTEAFLCRLVAEGNWTPAALESLAALRPSNMFSLVAPMVKHPNPEMRYVGAHALTLLDDPRGAPLVDDVVTEMRPPLFPPMVRGMPLDEARASLQARAHRMWGAH